MTASYTPQLKSRPFEAAFGKSLILCKKDEWNIIETWFTEGEEFIYYSSAEELRTIIDDVLNNFEKYEEIVENAYNRAINEYTTEAFVKKHFVK